MPSVHSRTWHAHAVAADRYASEYFSAPSPDAALASPLAARNTRGSVKGTPISMNPEILAGPDAVPPRLRTLSEAG